MSDASDSGEILNKALDLIAGREHTAHELRRKLISRGYDTDAVDQQLQRMRQERLLCDARFTEAYVHRRVGAGVGPLKIRHELEQKGIETDLVQRFLDPLGDRWDEMMAQQRVRRFGVTLPQDYRARMKQARFLQNRGFSPEAVMRLFR